MIESITNQYHSFDEIGKASLKMTAEKLDINIYVEEINDILNLITQLPPHPEVKNALAELQFKDFRMIALTKGSLAAIKTQMKFAELGQYFERLISLEEVKSYKPQPITYLYELNKMNFEAEDSLMVAARPWDLAGAKAVGMQTVFIQRPSQIYYPLMEKADINVVDLNGLEESLS